MEFLPVAFATKLVTTALGYIPFVLVGVDLARRSLRRISNAIDALFAPTYFIFYGTGYTPYVYHLMNPRASGSEEPTLLYNADTKLFFPWHEAYTFQELQELDTSCLPVLSFELVDKENGKAYYDLTDFIESVRYVELEGAAKPTIWHLLAAWSISSGIVPSAERLTARWIDGQGETVETALYSEQPAEESGHSTPAPTAEPTA